MTDTTDARGLDDEDTLDRPIRRGDTGIRLLLTLLFLLVWGIVEMALVLIALFSVVWALVTEQPAPQRLREFSNRLVTYAYRIWRYVTCNQRRAPFPFQEFPAALEASEDLGADDDPGVRGA